MTFKRIFVVYTSLFLLLMIVSEITVHTFPLFNDFYDWLWLLPLVYIISLFSIWKLIKTYNQKITKFINVFMLLSFGKMLLFIIILFAYAWFNPRTVIPFTLMLLVYYFTGLIYEVVFLLKLKQ